MNISITITLDLVNILLIKTGNAVGSDKEWRRIAKTYDIKINVIRFKEQPDEDDSVLIPDEELVEAIPYMKIANKTLGRYILSRNEYNNKLLMRNWFIIKDTKMTLAVGVISKVLVDGIYYDIVKGGTGWGVEFTKMLYNDLYVLHSIQNKWCKYNYRTNKFDYCEPLELKESVACIGTRELSATTEVYMKLPFSNHFGV